MGETSAGRDHNGERPGRRPRAWTHQNCDAALSPARAVRLRGTFDRTVVQSGDQRSLVTEEDTTGEPAASQIPSQIWSQIRRQIGCRIGARTRKDLTVGAGTHGRQTDTVVPNKTRSMATHDAT